MIPFSILTITRVANHSLFCVMHVDLYTNTGFVRDFVMNKGVDGKFRLERGLLRKHSFKLETFHFTFHFTFLPLSFCIGKGSFDSVAVFYNLFEMVLAMWRRFIFLK